jgi:hypothetical protein
MNWTHNKLLDRLRNIHSQIKPGTGRNEVIIKRYLPDDDLRIMVSAGAYSVTVPEDFYKPVMLGLKKYRR